MQADGLLFRTALVIMGDVFLLLAGTFSGIFGIVLAGLFFVKF